MSKTPLGRHQSPAPGPFEHSVHALLGVAITRRDMAQTTAEGLKSHCIGADEALARLHPCWVLAQAEATHDAWSAVANMLADVLREQQRGGRP